MLLQVKANAAAETFSGGFGMAWQALYSWIDGFFRILPNLIIGLVVMVLFTLCALAARRGAHAAFSSRGQKDLAAIVGSAAFWAVNVVGALIALTIILPTLKPGDLIASLGIGSIAVGFAFKEILQNWLAGVLLLLRQPFRRGDQIKVGKESGTVQRITSRAVYLKTFDGRRVIVPNSDVYSTSIEVDTAYDNRRVTLELTVGYDYNFRTIAKIIKTELADIEEILDEPAPEVLAWDLGGTSLGLIARWWIKPQRSQEVASRAKAVQAIKEAFEVNGIDPTDPQLIFLSNAADSGGDTDKSAGQSVRQLQRPIPPDPAKRAPVQDKSHVWEDDPEAERPNRAKGSLARVSDNSET